MRKPTKSERREAKKKNRNKMVVTGKSVKLLQQIIIDKGKK